MEVVGKCIGVRSDSDVIYSKVNLIVIEVLKNKDVHCIFIHTLYHDV